MSSKNTTRQCCIHCTLKCSRCTGEAENRNQKLILPKISLECSFWFFTWLEQNLMEAGSKTKSREPNGMRKFTYKLIKHWNWKLGLNSNGI